ncbi:ABC transporter [Streptomyces sp. NPDC004609]|uniref:ABC transporter n=1 Tax=Streptomyces sp. NPDC004609 TaxID=3364704 RepID=UPI0036BCC4B4
MTALFAYQTALLLRSQRWLPPLLLYAVFVAVGVQPGQPVLDSLGYTAAALVPVTAWLVRICANQEPSAARDVAAAATGAPRVHLAALLTALAGAGSLGAVAVAVVTLVSRASSADNSVAVPRLDAGAAGLLGAAVCVLTGAAVGALCTRPLLHGRGWSLAATALLTLLALVGDGSPAKEAVTGLVTGSRTGAVPLGLLPPVAALLIAGTVVALVCALTTWRGPAGGTS